jgi:hypothetical protein
LRFLSITHAHYLSQVCISSQAVSLTIAQLSAVFDFATLMHDSTSLPNWEDVRPLLMSAEHQQRRWLRHS